MYNSGLTQMQSVTSNIICVTTWMSQTSEGEGTTIFSCGLLCNNLGKIEWTHAGTLCEIKCHKVVAENLITEANCNFRHKVITQIFETKSRCFVILFWLRWYFLSVNLLSSAFRDTVQNSGCVWWRCLKYLMCFVTTVLFYFTLIKFSFLFFKNKTPLRTFSSPA